jgi:hypothetical protein
MMAVLKNFSRLFLASLWIFSSCQIFSEKIKEEIPTETSSPSTIQTEITKLSPNSFEITWSGDENSEYILLRSTYSLKFKVSRKVSFEEIESIKRNFPFKVTEVKGTGYIEERLAHRTKYYFTLLIKKDDGFETTETKEVETDNITLPENITNPRIVVTKSEYTLSLYSGNKLLKIYPVVLGCEPEKRKERQGDCATPEGEYFVCMRNPQSIFYKAFLLSYPNIEDAERGLREGLISENTYTEIRRAIENRRCPPQNTRLGSYVEIHGMGLGSNWTLGCIALRNEDMDELWRIVRINTEVIIRK